MRFSQAIFLYANLQIIIGSSILCLEPKRKMHISRPLYRQCYVYLNRILYTTLHTRMSRLLLFKIFFLHLFIFLPIWESCAQFSFRYDDAVIVFRGGKELQLPWAGGLNAGQYQPVDLNRDGFEDLVIFDRTSIKVNTFIWSEGRYDYSPGYEALFPPDLNGWLIIADYNCDGVEDIFTSSAFGIKAYRGSVVDGVLKWELEIDPINTEGFSSQVNLQVNSADIPAIVDIDGDGDLDIFVFNFARGGTIEYHQNLSLETQGNCGLNYKRETVVWGDFQECTCGVYVFGESCVDNNGRLIADPAKVLHAGGKALLLFDNDGDGDKDMLFGDEECDNLAFFRNNGNASAAKFDSFELRFPYDKPSGFLFPAGYLADVDHDGLQDLLIAPNLADNVGGSVDFQKSSLFYKNVGSSNIPTFEFQKNDFLQGEMIDRGGDATPALQDINQDGRIDLLVGNGGKLNDGRYYASIAVYENTGSEEIPEFTMLTEDFLGLSKLDLLSIQPGFADINGDGFQDLYFKGSSSNNTTSLYYLLSESGGFFESNLLKTFDDISVSSDDKIALGNVDEDDYADILIFRGSGRLDYYKNEAQDSEPVFSLVAENFAGFSVGFENRNLTPVIFDLNKDGRSELVISNAKGQIFFIEDIESHQSGLENIEMIEIQNSILNQRVQSKFGFGSMLAFASLFNGELPTLLVGSRQGGLYLLRNEIGGSGPGEEDFTLECYPNPAEDGITVKVSEKATVKIYNALGNLVWDNPLGTSVLKLYFDKSAFGSGIYFFKATNGKGRSVVKKVIVL